MEKLSPQKKEDERDYADCYYNLSCYKILKAENEEQLITALNDLSRALKINKEDPEDIRTDIDFKKVIDNPNANKMFEQILSDYC